MIDLSGKVAIVTGASRGIGKATALRLAGCGADVVVVALDEAANVEKVAEAVRALGRRSLAYVADVADFAAAHRIVAEVEKEFGRVDILVNNAGMSQPKRIVELSEEEWDRTVAVNLKSCFNWSRAVLPGMAARRWGRIVSISSMGAKNGGGPPIAVSRACYAATKAGIIGLTHGLAREVPPGVTVNAVAPGPIATELTQSIMGGPKGQAYADQFVPVGRIGTPDDIANAVAFLVSEEASFISGECTDVNGGMYLD